MFDTIRCCYPLPHHQDAEFQTKDVSVFVYEDPCLGGTMEDYEITEDGRLRRHAHEREWMQDPGALAGGYFRSIRDWWEDVPDAHGDILIYTCDEHAAAPGTLMEFRIRFTNGRVENVTEVVRDAEERPECGDGGGATVLPASADIDDRPEVAALLATLKASQRELRALLSQCSDEWGYDDPVYRFYHHSFKVYGLQSMTKKIVLALQAIRPGTDLHAAFLQIVAEGTGKTFEPAHNQRWLAETRPIVEAFFHARYFLEMAVRYGTRLSEPPRALPSGWAALLHLYGLR